MLQLLVTRPLPPPGPSRLAELEALTTVLPDGSEAAGRDLRALLPDADVVLTHLTERVDRSLLERCPRLRGISNLAVGYDNIDLVAATDFGIPVATTPGVLTETTADLTWAALLGIARRIAEADHFTRAGRFERWGAELLLGADVGPGPDGRPKVLGVVGFGRIGEAVARRATGFSMEVLAHDPRHRDRIDSSPHARWSEFSQLLERSDFVTLHVPLTTETHHLISTPELQQMQATAYLVNTARGPVIDETALLEGLRSGEIAGAALDVFEFEPRLTPGLTGLDNVLLLPHIGSASHATRGSMAATAVANAAAHLAGRPAPHVINPEVYATDRWRRRVS